jgi:hypothetical protein
MRNHTRAVAALAIVLVTTAFADVNAQTPAFGAGTPATISPEDLHRQVNVGNLPITIIDEPY